MYDLDHSFEMSFIIYGCIVILSILSLKFITYLQIAVT